MRQGFGPFIPSAGVYFDIEVLWAGGHFPLSQRPAGLMTLESSLELPEAIAALGTARAMRWYRDDPVPAALIDKVIWAGTRASSPNNCQPWDFVVVQDPAVRRRIGDLLRPQAPWPDPPAGTDLTQRRTLEGARNLIAHFGEVPVLIFICGVNTYPSVDSPDITFMYSAVYAAAQNMVVAARALGLGCAFTTLHRQAEAPIRDLLQIPEDRTLAVTMPLGWPARPFGPVTRRPVEEVLHRDRW